MGVAKFVREHREWSVQSEEWTWTDDAPAWLRHWEGDGIIVRIENRKLAALVLDLGVKTVDVRGSVKGLRVPLIDTDDEKVACLAAEHLMSLGFRHYAFCGFVGANYSDTRCYWFQHHLAQHGFSCMVFNPQTSLSNVDTLEYEKRSLDFREEIAHWVASIPKPIGVMACNDICGQKLLDTCRRNGVLVPEELAVIGVDNDEVLCELSDPPLTSVVPDAVRIGYSAATLLEQLMGGRSPPAEPILVPPTGIVARRSTEVLALEDRHLAAGLRFLRENAFHTFRVDDAARVAGMSRRVFERRFAAQIGHPPKAEVTRLRLERAKQLLAETDWNLAEIAQRTGLNYAEYLHKVFTSKTGITPGQFRHNQKNKGTLPGVSV
jgi:LacI family transcriptional regulator